MDANKLDPRPRLWGGAFVHNEPGYEEEPSPEPLSCVEKHRLEIIRREGQKMRADQALYNRVWVEDMERRK